MLGIIVGTVCTVAVRMDACGGIWPGGYPRYERSGDEEGEGIGEGRLLYCTVREMQAHGQSSAE